MPLRITEERAQEQREKVLAFLSGDEGRERARCIGEISRRTGMSGSNVLLSCIQLLRDGSVEMVYGEDLPYRFSYWRFDRAYYTLPELLQAARDRIAGENTLLEQGS